MALTISVGGQGVTGSEEKVPIRWMAQESMKHDIYNEETDVVCIMNALFVCNSYCI